MVAGSWRRWWGPGCGWGRGGAERRLRGPLLGCVRLCDHAATISSPDSVHRQWLDVPVQGQVPTVQTAQLIVEISLPLLDRFLTCPLLCNVGVQFACQGRQHLSRGADAVSLGLSVQKTIEILQLQFIDKVFDVCCAGPAVLGCRRGGDSRAPTVAARFAWTLSFVAMPVVVQRQLPGGSDVRKLRRSRSCRVDVPFVQVDIWVRPVLGQGR